MQTRLEIPCQDTRCEMTFIVMPNHLNALDTVFGGQVMAWIDVCAGVSAQRFTRGNVVTASMDHLTFLAPIRKGEVTVLRSQVNWAGRTSLEVGVRVESEDIRTGLRRHTSSAYLTMVSLDDAGRPRPVPLLVPGDEEERRRFDDARHRREMRLQERDRARRARGERG
jgi:acyl-CoA hydrolase